MRIDENKVYMFTFETGEMGNLAIPVRAMSREEAAETLQKMLNKMQVEIAMEFPREKGEPGPDRNIKQVDVPAVPGGIPSEVIQSRIETLMKSLGAVLVTKDTPGLTPEAFSSTIKQWTEMDYTPANYAKIAVELELIASGQKEIAPPKPKKKA